MKDPVDIAHDEYHKQLVDLEERNPNDVLYANLQLARHNATGFDAEHIIDETSSHHQALLDIVCADIHPSKQDHELTAVEVDLLLHAAMKLRKAALANLKNCKSMTETYHD